MDPQLSATLVEAYLAGATMREVAARHGISTKTVQLAMRQMGAQTRSPAERQGTPPVEEWAALYADGATTAQIAAQYGVTEQWVRQRLRRHGVALPRPPRPQPHKRSRNEVDVLVGRYMAGETLTEIGQELGITQTRVQQILRDSGADLDVLTPMHRVASNRLKERSDRKLLEHTLAENPTRTVRELADATGMPRERVKRLLGPESPARRRPSPRTPARHSLHAHLAGLLAYAKVMGLPEGARVSGPAYDEWAAENGGPSRAALVRHFGSWAEAARQAGFQPMVTPRRPYRRLSHEEAVAVVAAFIQDEQKQGRPPNSRFYSAWAKQHRAPSLAGLGLYWRWSQLVTEALRTLAEP